MKKISLFFIHSFLSLTLSAWSLSGHATAGWPAFSLPDGHFLIDRGHVQTESCPPGQGKIMTGTQISMQPLCRGYCPQSWMWQVAESDGGCHDLKHFTSLRHEIIHYPDTEHNNNAPFLYSEVKVVFGDKDSARPLFQLVFTSPKEHWYCVQLTPEFPVITCANDM